MLNRDVADAEDDETYEDAVQARLCCFNDTLDACNSVTTAPTAAGHSNGGGGALRMLGPQIYQRVLHYAARMLEPSVRAAARRGATSAATHEAFATSGAPLTALFIVRMLVALAIDPGVKAAAQAQRAAALQRAAVGTASAAVNHAATQAADGEHRRRAREEDDLDTDVQRQRAAAHLLEICGGAASRGEDSSVLRSCRAFMTDDGAAYIGRYYLCIVLQHVFRDVFGVEGIVADE
jgi:hypothetical protein